MMQTSLRFAVVRPVVELRPDEIVVDCFAGGGGASVGIEAALGRPVDEAINHDTAALRIHEANHPHTRHWREDIWRVDPMKVAAGRPVGLAWFSPDCTHFSRAKGGQPVKKKIRSLAWTVTRWMRAVRPRIVFVENVGEFTGWGPVVDGQPCPRRRGQTFRAWVRKIRKYGYQVEWRKLVAADYGAPTSRERFFLIARCDGEPIVWPEPTHGPGCPNPHRTAAEIIDWSLPCPSIFLTKEEGRQLGVKRPLAEATLRRIAKGLERFVFKAARPFIVPLTHQGDARVHGLDEPLRTVTAANRGELALVAPTLVQTGYGERHGQEPRALDLGKPLGTVVAGGSKHALVAAFLEKGFGGPNGHQTPGAAADGPVPAVTTKDHTNVAAVFLSKFHGTSIGAEVTAPCPTVLTGGGRGGGHLAEVRAFLVQYNGQSIGQRVDASLRTVTTRDRFGLVTVEGELWQIVDIGLRMLTAEELKRAMGFPVRYDMAPIHDGKRLGKTAQIDKIGNAVCPQVAEALVRANVRATKRAQSGARKEAVAC